MEKDALYRAAEKEIGTTNAFCLHCLFDSIACLSTALDSPFGGYDKFLASEPVERLMKANLTFDDIHTFVANMMGVQNERHLLLLLCDEVNAAEAELSSKVETFIIQRHS